MSRITGAALRSRVTAWVAVVATLVSVLALAAQSPLAEATSDPGVAVVNELRAVAGLPPVLADTEMTRDAKRHAEYMVRTGAIAHHQDPDSVFYTPAGDAAARESNLKVSPSATLPVRSAIEALMVAPFHGVAFVDPRLDRAGGALHHDADAAPWRSGYAINVLGGRAEPAPAGTPYPILWPGDGSTVALTRYDGGESPEPLTSCPGFLAPTGLPILVQFADAERVTAAAVRDSSGEALTVCHFDQFTYAHGNAHLREVGREALAARNAAVVIPRHPLVPGESYTVEVSTAKGTTTWTFSVGDANRPPTGR